MDWFWLILLGIGGVAMWGMYTGKLQNTFLAGEGLDGTIDRQFGILNAIKPPLLHCPNGYARFNGYRYNKSGSVDIFTLDGRWILNVDLLKNVKDSGSVLSRLCGLGETLVNVELDTGKEVDWQMFAGRSDDNAHLVNLVDQTKRQLMNVLAYGNSPFDGNLYHSRMNEDTKNLGKILRNLGKGGYTQQEVRMSRPTPVRDEEGEGYGE